jgi:hypothetical protein
MPPRKRGSIPISEETLYLLRNIQMKSGAQTSAGGEVDPATQFNTEVKNSGSVWPIFYGSTELVGLDLLCEVPQSHSATPHSVGLLWTSDRVVAETYT